MAKESFFERITRSARRRKSVIALALLMAAIVFVYGWWLWPKAARAETVSPEVAKIMAQDRGKPLQFPMFRPHRHFDRQAWRHMTRAQRHAMWQQRRAHFEAFMLEFAQATPAERQAVVKQVKARFEQMHRRRQAQPHPHWHGHGGPGNFAARLPHMMAHMLTRGNPQMHAAMTQFFMMLHNTH